jgi:hypothetical protein
MAVDILANPDAEEHAGAIRTAALLPPIHSELWEKYGNELPSDATLEWELTKDRGFTETGAREFIPVYRDTIAYAKLEASTLGQPQSRGTVWSQDPASDGGDGADDESGPRRRLRMHVSAGRATYAVPLASGGLVALEGDFPISERDWQQLMAVLNAMKPGLVMEPPRQSGAGGDEDENA